MTFRPFFDKDSKAAFERLVSLVVQHDSGVAVVGAGLSMPAYPSWEKFYEEIRQSAIKAGVPQGNLAPKPTRGLAVGLNVVHAELGEAAFVTEVRRIFAPNGAPLPHAYSLLASIEVLELATWNVEEFLATAALPAGRNVNSYPDFLEHHRPHQATYLHGRAIAARSMDDLVFTDDAYTIAYRPDSLLHRVLNWLFWQRPVVFVGSSLTDPVFNQALNQIRRQQGAGGSQPGGRIAPLHLFALVKAVDPAQVIVETKEYAAIGVIPIWYVQDDQGGHGELLSVLDHLKMRTTRLSATEPPAADLIVYLSAAERLARTDSPTIDDQELASRLLASELVARTFFHASPRIGWFPYLEASGYLAPREPEQGPNREWQARSWVAGEYIGYLAQAHPGLALRFLVTLRTSNWLALSLVGTALRRLPTDVALELSAPLTEWLTTPFALQSGLASDAMKVVHEAAGQSDSRVVRFAAPILDTVFGATEGPFADHLARTFRADILPSLLETSARDVFLVAREDLANWMERDWGDDPAADASMVQRPAIEDSSQNAYLRRLDYLVEVVRDSLHAMVDQEAYGPLLLETYRARWPILRRIAINEARISSRGKAALAGALAVDMSALLFDLHLYHEVSMFIESLETAPPELQTAVQQAIDSGPPGASDESQARWRRRWLHLAPESLLSDAQQRERQTTTPPFDPELESRHFLMYSTGVFHPTAPIDQVGFDQRAALLDPQSVLGLVRDPSASGVEVLFEHDAEQMWDLLVDYVARSDRRDILLLATAEDLERRGGWKVVSAALQGVESLDEWRVVLDWLASLAVAGGTASWAVADAIRDHVVGQIPLMLVDHVLSIIEGIVDRESTDLSSDLQAEDDFARHRDLMFRELNRAAGKASWALLGLTDRVRLLDQQRAMPPWLIQLVERSAEGGWGGIELRIAIGSLFPVLRAVDPDAAGRTRPSLLPPADDLSSSNARVAFWTGYLYRGEVSSDDLNYLLEEYLLELDSSSLDQLQEELQARLMDHVVVGYLRGLDGFTTAIASILTNSDGASRRQRVARALGRFIREDENIAPALAYWRQHLDLWEATEDFNVYLAWGFRMDAANSADILPLMLRSIRPIPPEHEVYGVLEYLESVVTESPHDVLTVLRRVLEDWDQAEALRWFAHEVSGIALRLASTEVRSTPEYHELVNGLLSSGRISLDDARRVLGLEPS